MIGQKGKNRSTPLHLRLLADPDQMLSVYDQAAQEVIDVGRPEGYYDGWSEEELRWPASSPASGPIDAQALARQARLVTAIYEGVPERRDSRLADAHERFTRVAPRYLAATRTYLQVRRQFLARGAGSAEDFLRLYQRLYLDALAAGQLFVPDAGEAALERARISRVPLAHAHAGAEALAVAESDEPGWSDVYSCTVDGETNEGSLRELLRQVVQQTLDYIQAGDLLATRYNTYSNLAWFGCSVWKVVIDAQLLLARLRGNPDHRLTERELALLQREIHRGQSMMIEFFQAHQEDPGRLKPASYWYGHNYSYLTRDMVDFTNALVERANLLIRRARQSDRTPDQRIEELALPPLLAGRNAGRFLEYPHVGKRGELSSWSRAARLGRWLLPSLKNGQRKRARARQGLEEKQRLEAIWGDNIEWANTTLRTFGVEVRVVVDPGFAPIAEELALSSGKQKILFLPTHQSVLDHPIMYRVLESPELLAAMGWKKPVPCTLFARAGMGMAGMRIGRWSLTMFGMSAGTFDRLLEEVDGYVVADRGGDTKNAIQRFAKLLEKRPGVLYPALTTAAFDIQSPPLQHSLFALLPQDVVIIPLAFRGSHALLPKCPKGNLRINPGLVEVVVSPPILGETTLLPRRRSLRIQVEAAALFQTVHITSLLNPAPSTTPSPH